MALVALAVKATAPLLSVLISAVKVRLAGARSSGPLSGLEHEVKARRRNAKEIKSLFMGMGMKFADISCVV